MVISLVRRFLSLAMLLVVGGGGGGMPVLDSVAFHGGRLSESFRTHYEASSSCHADGCSIRSDVAPRVLGDHAPQAPAVVATELVEPVPVGATVPSSRITLHYLSRAPPSA